MRRFEGIWRKRQLLPCWILQMLCAAIFTVIACLLLAAAGYIRSHGTTRTSSTHYYGFTRQELIVYANATGAVVLVLSIGTILFDLIEAVLFAKRRLDPVLLLSFACVKTLVWTVYFILSIIAAASGTLSALDLVLSLVLAITSVTQLIFGAKYTHRKRKNTLHRGDNAKSEGGAGNYQMGNGDPYGAAAL
ncbi:hypothetical protein F5B20DRAFT_583106 [Whalleya microplaca]|nr:hypothetical protein F5B20DRAFT_583106 [Whalleya microplaca]